MQENVLLGEARPFGQVEQEYCVASVWFWNCPSGHDEQDVVADSAYCPLPQAWHFQPLEWALRFPSLPQVVHTALWPLGPMGTPRG